jgi:hypothetical protein
MAYATQYTMIYTMVYTLSFTIWYTPWYIWHGIYGWNIARYITYGIYYIPYLAYHSTLYAIYHMLCRTYRCIYHRYISWYNEWYIHICIYHGIYHNMIFSSFITHSILVPSSPPCATHFSSPLHRLECSCQLQSISLYASAQLLLEWLCKAAPAHSSTSSGWAHKACFKFRCLSPRWNMQ